MINEYPTKCNLCGGNVIHTTNDRIYGRQYGNGWCYFCLKCGCFVGTHKNEPRRAMGILANEQMRKGKQMCHEIFDKRWKGKKYAHKKRRGAYCWLASQMRISVKDCHFGHFDLEQLRKAYKILIHN